MFISGFVLIMGLAFIFIKLPRRMTFWLLGHDVALDVSVVVLMTLVHWGTFTGLMAAAFAGLLCSGFTSGAKWAFGYTSQGRFVPGKFNVRAP